MRRALLPILLLTSLSLAGFQTPETYTLVHKNAVGDTQKVELKVEQKFSQGVIEQTVNLASKVTEVAADGSYTVEITATDPKVTFNGEAQEIEAGEPKVQTQKYDAKGRLIRDAGEEAERTPMDIIFEFEPTAPVKIGDKWTPEKREGEPQPLEWTLIGKEKVGEAEFLVVEGKGKGPKDEAVESKLWLDPVSFIARRAKSSIKGIKTPDGSEEIEMNVSFEEKA